MTFKFTFDELKIDPKALSESQFREFAGKELSNQQKRLDKRLDRGKDADEKTLARYSDSYEKQIKKGPVKGTRGSNRKGIAPTNLTVSGGLRASRRVGLTKNGATLEFSGSFGGTSYAALAAKIYKKRPGWMKFSNRDIETVEKRFAKEFDKILKKIVDIKRNRGT